MRQFNNLDKSFEAYLASLAGDTLDNQTVKAAPVRVHYQSREAGIWVPMGQSLITGLFVALAVLVLWLALGWPKAWFVAGIVLAMVSLGMWLYSIWDWRKLIHRLEDLTKRDLNHDFQVGEPERSVIEIHSNEDGGRSVKFLNLPVSLDRLSELAKGMLDGVTFSEGNWVGADNLFNRREFSEIRTKFIERGIFEWSSPGTPARGVKITRTGWAVLRYLAGVHHSPTGEDLS